MSMHFAAIAEQALADGRICADDVLALRRAGWASGRIEPEEAEAIFAVNHGLDQPCPEWSDFFVEAIGDYVVNQLEPRGYVTEANAAWLVERIDHDRHLHSQTELELLVRVFEKAESTPPLLREHALRGIETAVLTGTGTTGDGGSLDAGRVNRTEARILRRILFAPGSERPAGISRSEAELLFRIKDATLHADNDPEWQRLFVQGVGNYLQGFTAHEPLSRDRAAQLESFMNDRSSSIGRFIGKLARSTTGANRLGVVFGRRPAAPPASLVDAARAVTSDERDWLDAMIDGNGEIDEYDRALLEFLAEDGFPG